MTLTQDERRAKRAEIFFSCTPYKIRAPLVIFFLHPLPFFPNAPPVIFFLQPTIIYATLVIFFLAPPVNHKILTSSLSPLKLFEI